MKKKQSLRVLKKKCWRVFSEFVRRKYSDSLGMVHCYTCGKPMFWMDAHAGHALPGRHNAVLFDQEIVRPQCPVCNIWKGGNYPIFTTKLIKENGMEWWEKKLEASRQVVKYTRPDLESMVTKFKEKLEAM